MSTEDSDFDTFLFVQLCGGEPALYDPSCQGNIEAACRRISRTLEKRTTNRVPPSSVKPFFDKMRAIYEKETMERAQGGFKELNWYSPMDVYMRRFLSWDQCPSNPSESSYDPEVTDNPFNGNKHETVRQGISHSEPLSNFEETLKENGNNHALENESKVTNVIPDRIDIGNTSNTKVTARKSLNTPTKGINNNAEVEGTTKSGHVKKIPSDDDPCDVCRRVLPELENEMLYCDSCDVCVHQDCYGVDKIPEGQWFCSPCSLNIQPQCELCPKPGGAMKRISDECRWAHVSCALWVKEAEFLNKEKMEQINISNIPDNRWRLVCSLCRVKHGACIQCMAPRCTVAYHTTCAIDSKEQTIEICVSAESKHGVKMLTYCKKHSLVGPSNSHTKGNQKRKNRKSSTGFKKPSKHKRSLSRDGDFINEAFPKLDHRTRLSESESTSNSSLGSGAEFSSSSEENEQPSAKRIKHSESGSNAEREPDITSTAFSIYQSSSSSLDTENTNEAHATTWSKTASIEQLTKTVAVAMRNLPDKEAKKLERKIVWLCIKSRSTKENQILKKMIGKRKKKKIKSEKQNLT